MCIRAALGMHSRGKELMQGNDRQQDRKYKDVAMIAIRWGMAWKKAMGTRYMTDVFSRVSVLYYSGPLVQ